MEKDEIMEMLDDEIKAQIEDIKSMKTGSQEKSAAIVDLMDICKVRNEDRKNVLDYEQKTEKTMLEDKRSAEELHERKVDRWVRTGVDVALVIIPMIFYGKQLNKGYKFEETGCLGSQTFRESRQFFSRFLKKR